MKNFSTYVLWTIMSILILGSLLIFIVRQSDKPQDPERSGFTPNSTTTTPPSSSPESTSEVTPQTITVQVYFSNEMAPEGEECTTVYPVERTIPHTQSVARTALQELLKGPTQSDLNEGYYTSINQNVKIQRLEINNRIAKVDFSEELDTGVGGSCRVSAIRAQITQTLLQFPTVSDVIISINGRTEDILQP